MDNVLPDSEKKDQVDSGATINTDSLVASENKKDFPIILLAGLSGAGKSSALNVLEDMGYFTVDGLPPSLTPQVASAPGDEILMQYNGLVIGLDLRRKNSILESEKAINTMIVDGINPRIIFVEASPEVIMRRYATTRRPHPLESEGMGLEQAVHEERMHLLHIRELSNLIIDSSDYSIHDLRRIIQKKYNSLLASSSCFKLHLISFGFKYGLPTEADMMFDLRFLPNPFFVEELRPMSGLDPQVAEYVLGQEPGNIFYSKTLDFLNFLLPLYQTEGRYRLGIGIGCTGGRHRSVAVTEALGAELKKNGYSITIEHRHLELG